MTNQALRLIRVICNIIINYSFAVILKSSNFYLFHTETILGLDIRSFALSLFSKRVERAVRSFALFENREERMPNHS